MKRSTSTFATALVLLAFASSLAVVTGCVPIGKYLDGSVMMGTPDEKERQDAADKAVQQEGTVMQYQEGATDTLVGEWYWPNGEIDFRDEHRMNPVWIPVEGNAEWHLTIIKKGDEYTTDSGGTVKLDGKHFTISEKVGSRGDTVSFTGDIVGDTLVGTVHKVIVAKPNTGEGIFDIPWTATRVK